MAEQHPINPQVLLMSASPRSEGTSTMLLQRIQRTIGGDIVFLYKEKTETLLDRIEKAETIVLSGPCYINSYPSPVIALLEAAAERSPWRGQNLYGIINGGMPYIHTHQSGIDSLEIFAEQCNFTWKGGFVLGGGAMLNGQPLEKHLAAKRVVPAFDAFTQHIAAKEASPKSLYVDAQPIPGKLTTRFFAKMLSFMVTRNLKKHGHDIRGPRAYFKNH